MSHLSSLRSLINLILRIHMINNFVHVHLVCSQFQFSETKSNFPAILESKLALLAEVIREALLKTLTDAAELACTLKQIFVSLARMGWRF